jgi:hypothetical protein
MNPETIDAVNAFLARHFHNATCRLDQWGIRLEILVDGVVVATLAENTIGGARGTVERIDGYVISGPHFPKLGQQRWGDGKVRRKTLGDALAASLAYLRGDTPYEAARRASEAAALAQSPGVRPPSTQDAMLVALYDATRAFDTSWITGLDELIERIKEAARAVAAAAAMREMYEHFDLRLKGTDE